MTGFNFDSLAFAASSAFTGSGEPIMVHPETLEPSENNPRRHAEQEIGEEWERFKANILTRSVEVPIEVSEPKENGKRTIYKGHRRWRAALETRLQRVPIIVKKSDAAAADDLVLYNDNQQRKQMHPVDDALFLIELAAKRNLSTRDLADTVFISFSHAQRALSCKSLPVEVMEQLRLNSELSLSQLSRFAKLHADDSLAAMRMLDASGQIQWPTEAPKINLIPSTGTNTEEDTKAKIVKKKTMRGAADAGNDELLVEQGRLASIDVLKTYIAGLPASKMQEKKAIAKFLIQITNK